MNQPAHQNPLIVVGGWGVDAAMLLPLFDSWPGEIHLVSLSDALMSRCESVTDVAAYLLGRYPCPSVWAGWSQGAQVVMAAASLGGPQVPRVITVSGFPRFVAGPEWPAGMARGTFDTFKADVASQEGRAWQRFQQLLIHGCEDHRQARRDLLPWLRRGALVSSENLIRGLEWLEKEDQMALWRMLSVPTLHLQAERDAVVRPWSNTFTPAESSEVVTIPGMTHWPRGHAVTRCRDEIHRFAFARGSLWQI